MAKDKVSQAARREIREHVSEQYRTLEQILRPRPRRCPRWLWQFIANIVIDTKKLHDFLNNGAKPVGDSR